MSAFKRANILLPKKTDMSKWAVVACDQYTSEPDYWEDVQKITGGCDSTLSMILPEVYLEDDDVDERIKKIHSAMNDYISKDLFNEYKDCFIYVERTQNDGRIRQGLVGMIDLEEYDYSAQSRSSVRATEQTVVERIPPRIKVRRNAPLELPHIMILIDDADKTVIEPFEKQKDQMKMLYDFELMKNGGSIKGYLVKGNLASRAEKALDELGSRSAFNKRYVLNDAPVLLYAMGDGNHSLATAKAFYEELKKQYPDTDISDHPARYALVEIVNLHSGALCFEAIHRIVCNVDTADLINKMESELSLSDSPGGQTFKYICGETEKTVSIGRPTANMTVGSLQGFLDKYISENGGKIDYIHGENVLKSLAAKEGCIGFVLPDMQKSELFPTVIKDGALVRKTFSMGHAEDKRFYIECRKITE